MQIKIEIDVQPEELRRFLGLPDVTGLQEEIVSFLRDKVSDANESFDPAAFVRANLDTLRSNKAVRRLLYGTAEEDTVEPEKPAPKRRRASPRSGSRGKR